MGILISLSKPQSFASCCHGVDGVRIEPCLLLHARGASSLRSSSFGDHSWQTSATCRMRILLQIGTVSIRIEQPNQPPEPKEKQPDNNII